MLKVISFKDIAANADLFYSQFRLRHREFIERQHYDVKTIDGMEFDEYDTLASVYLVYTEDNKTVLGCSRLTPIEYGSMLADHFPELVDDCAIFQAPNIWEGTRFCIDRRLRADQRRQICVTLCAGYIEFGLQRGVDQIIGLMPTIILRTVFERSGIVLERLGSVRPIGELARIQAASIHITPEQAANVARHLDQDQHQPAAKVPELHVA